MKTSIFTVVCVFTMTASSSGFAATCNVFERTNGSNYKIAQKAKQVDVGQKIVQVPNRLYILQHDDDGNLTIMGLLFPLGTLEGGKFGDPTYVGAVGSHNAVTLVDYSANTQIVCQK